MTAVSTEVDTARLATYLSHNGIDVSGELRCRLITGGRSNLTFELTDEEDRRHVLRMPPRVGHTRSHNVAREHSVLRALARSQVPVPQVEILCEDPDVLGAPFYVAEFVDGVVLRTHGDGERLTPAARGAAARSIVDALATVHAVQLAENGLDQLGKGDGYIERQLQRWADHSARPGAVAGSLLLDVHAALAATRPPAAQAACLVHGDYNFINVLVDAETGNVRAVLDWELATIGDPLADLGYLLAMWPEREEKALFDAPTRNEGFLTRAEVVNRYAEQTGFDVSAVAWYQAFALWKGTCLLDGVVERYRNGAMGADDFDADKGAQLVEDLGRAALALVPDSPTAAPKTPMSKGRTHAT